MCWKKRDDSTYLVLGLTEKRETSRETSQFHFSQTKKVTLAWELHLKNPYTPTTAVAANLRVSRSLSSPFNLRLQHGPVQRQRFVPPFRCLTGLDANAVADGVRLKVGEPHALEKHILKAKWEQQAEGWAPVLLVKKHAPFYFGNSCFGYCVAMLGAAN